MVGLRTKIRGIAVLTVFGAGMAGVLVAGCGDDTTGPGADAGEDVQTDSTQPDVSQPDVTQPDVAAEAAPQDASQDATHPDASPDGAPDASPDVAQDVAHIDAAPDAAGDAPQDARSDVSDAGSTDAVADSSPEAAPPADASDAGDAGEAGEAGCTTTIGELNDSGTSQLLFGFDTASEINGWMSFNFMTADGTNVLTQSPTQGPPGLGCPGALSLALTYSAYNVNAGADNFFTAQNWTGRVRLHFWVKLVTSDYTTINGVEEFVESGNFLLKQFSPFLSGAAFAGGGWVESVVDLTQVGNIDLTTIEGFEVSVSTIGTMLDGGAAVPPPATLLVDDIWLE
jgi:hypothetical protein